MYLNFPGMPDMSTIELSGLEYQVDHLLRSLERLQAENASLRQKVTVISRKCSFLVNQNQQVAIKIRKIIAQLREDLP